MKPKVEDILSKYHITPQNGYMAIHGSPEQVMKVWQNIVNEVYATGRDSGYIEGWNDSKADELFGNEEH